MNELLNKIRAALHERKGDLMEISRESGVKYDTLRRIRSGDGYEPGFYKVDALAKYFKFEIKIKQR